MSKRTILVLWTILAISFHATAYTLASMGMLRLTKISKLAQKFMPVMAGINLVPKKNMRLL